MRGQAAFAAREIVVWRWPSGWLLRSGRVARGTDLLPPHRRTAVDVAAKLAAGGLVVGSTSIAPVRTGFSPPGALSLTAVRIRRIEWPHMLQYG